jgi:hypothetical protein
MTFLLSGATGTSVGSFYHVGDGNRIKYLTKYTCQFWWDVTGADTITAMTIKLWGSVDGIHTPGNPLCEHVCDAAELANEGGKFNVVNMPIEYIKAEISVLTKTGGTASVDIVFAPTFPKSM